MLDLFYPVESALQRLDDGLGVVAVLEVWFLAIYFPQFGQKGHGVGYLLGQQCLNTPVLDQHKSFDLAFAVHHQAQGHGLHPPGGEPLGAPDALPEQGADAVAYQPVEDAPRLLGFDQRQVERADLLERSVDSARGDLVKGDAVDRHTFGQAQYLKHVPGDGLALAVQVGGQVDGVYAGGGFFEAPDRLLFARRGHIVRAELIFDVHAHLFAGQVADVPHRGHHAVAPSQNFPDSPGLGR